MEQRKFQFSGGESDGKVKAQKTTSVKGKTLKVLVKKNFDIKNLVLDTDEFKGYIGMQTVINHNVVNYQNWFVKGGFYTNSIESF